MSRIVISSRSRRPAITSSSSTRIRGSSPTVGSSRKSTRGSRRARVRSRAAGARRRCSVPTGRSISSVRRSASARSTMRSAASRRVGRPTGLRASRGSAVRSVRGRRPPPGRRRSERARARAARVRRRSRASAARPPVGTIVVVSMPTVVDLPAPFGPSSPNTSPGATSKVDCRAPPRRRRRTSSSGTVLRSRGSSWIRSLR